MSSVRRALATGRPATVVAAVLFAVLIISFRPFQPTGAGLTGDSGDIVNQLGFGVVGITALCSLLTLADRRTVAALLSPWWLLLLCLLGLSVFNTPVPADTMRSFAFSFIGIMTVVAVLALPRDAEAFSHVLAFVGFLVLGLCYFGVIAMPRLAIHQPGEVEVQLAGLWRGLFTHKNIAGPIMVNFSFAGIYLWRRGWRWTGGWMFVLAMIFVLNTGSKTAAATMAFSALLVAAPGLFGARLLVPALVIPAFCGMAVATLGIVFLEPVKHLAAAIAPDVTYTGRTSIWEFAGEMIAKRPWTGYGFENFWLTDTVLRTYQPFDRAWDVRGAVHGHDGYLDMAIDMGLPAMAVAVVAFVLVPLRDYLRVPLYRENILLADFFMMIIVFSLLDAFLESFFFRRTDPVWMCFVMAVLGVRLAARVQIRPRGGR
jgi:O-antigen ligase